MLNFADNHIEDLAPDLIGFKRSLIYMMFSKNNLVQLRKTIFDNLPYLAVLSVSQNKITQLPDYVFSSNKLVILFADDNLIKRLRKHTFAGAVYLREVRFMDNPLEIIEEGALNDSPYLHTLYLVNTRISFISSASLPSSSILEITFAPADEPQSLSVPIESGNTLSNKGYSCVTLTWEVGDDGEIQTTTYTCTACLRGEYMAGERCLKCPAGGFYQDVFAYKAASDDVIGCKTCPAGQYVSPEKSPGRKEHDCSACPKGTRLDQWAGFRACLCLPNHYRLDRFGVCEPCTRGLRCTNESINLLPGFYWKWKSDLHKQAYANFSEEIWIFDDSYQKNKSQFNDSVPWPYSCPLPNSCLGGQDSSCTKGYTGPLCAVCVKGYYQLVSSCQECPTTIWLVVRVVGVIISIVVLRLLWMKTRSYQGSHDRSASDMILARLKITISFYQVTSGTLIAFSYVRWPISLIKLVSYAEVIQLNLMQFLPIECFSRSLQFDPFAGISLYLSLNTVIVAGCIGYFYARKLVYSKTKLMSNEERETEASKLKVQLYRAVFLTLFVTYPAACTRIFQILPAACHDICISDHEGCSSYLRSDYRVQCYTKKHNLFVGVSLAATVFPIAFPMITLFLLWKFYYKPRSVNTNTSSEEDTNEISAGMRFLYENYTPSCWYWEVIELVRKVVLTSVLAYVGAEGRSYLGTAAILSGIYAVLHAYFKPMKNMFEHWLQLIALLATSVNYNAALLLRIPDEDDLEVNSQVDAVGVTVLLIFANVLVVITIAVRYMVTAWSILCQWTVDRCCLADDYVLSEQRKRISSIDDVHVKPNKRGPNEESDRFSRPYVGETGGVGPFSSMSSRDEKEDGAIREETKSHLTSDG